MDGYLQNKVLSAHRSLFGKTYIFDGSILFLQNQIEDCSLETEVKGTRYQVIIKLTKEIKPGEIAPLQLYNIILRHVILFQKCLIKFF